MTNPYHGILWSPRVPKSKIHQLYTHVAQGIWPVELIDDVGMTLYMRCRDILNIHRAKTQCRVTCPNCQRAGTTTLIDRPSAREAPMLCPICGWSMNWLDYHKSFQRRQLNPGGAVQYFQEFITQYESAADPKQKMLAIDRVIHQFHFSLRELPDQPTRAAGVNLIDGNLTDVVKFLDQLKNPALPDEFQKNHTTWKVKQQSINWDEIAAKKNAEHA